MSECELMAAIRGRRSVRRFEDRPVPRALLERLIEAAAMAPSAGNRQDWHFTVVTSRPLIMAMAEAVRVRWEKIRVDNADHGFAQEVADYAIRYTRFGSVPAVIVVSARPANKVQEHLLGAMAPAAAGGAASAAMAAQNLMLAAHAEDLGSCCMTGPLAASEELAQMLDLGRRQQIVCLIALGWPAEIPSAPPRKPLAEITRFIE